MRRSETLSKNRAAIRPAKSFYMRHLRRRAKASRQVMSAEDCELTLSPPQRLALDVLAATCRRAFCIGAARLRHAGFEVRGA